MDPIQFFQQLKHRSHLKSTLNSWQHSYFPEEIPMLAHSPLLPLKNSPSPSLQSNSELDPNRHSREPFSDQNFEIPNRSPFSASSQNSENSSLLNPEFSPLIGDYLSNDPEPDYILPGGATLHHQVQFYSCPTFLLFYSSFSS
jgi:hypothetical protein